VSIATEALARIARIYETTISIGLDHRAGGALVAPSERMTLPPPFNPG
jgi:hypothetical protein